MTEAERLTAGILPLVDWFREHARQLPWRSDPTPYHVLVSELMLQQTRVAAVLTFFRRFTEALPDVAALAACPENELLKLWEGLGYYSRARNLKRTACIICEQYNGSFPQEYSQLLSLPGVGEYTAGAIASIAFGQAEPAVDGNVLRVITRLLADEGDITSPAVKRRIRTLIAEILPTEFPGLFNQALMELGALVCLPNGAPQCSLCPWAQLCLAHQNNLTATIPNKPPKRPRRIERRQVYLIFNANRVALRQRPGKGLLASLWEFPNELDGTPLPTSWGVVPQTLAPAGAGRHIFTHIEWHMTAISIQTDGEQLPDGWVWASRSALLEQYPVPSAFSAFMPTVLSHLEEGFRDL